MGPPNYAAPVILFKTFLERKIRRKRTRQIGSSDGIGFGRKDEEDKERERRGRRRRRGLIFIYRLCLNAQYDMVIKVRTTNIFAALLQVRRTVSMAFAAIKFTS